MMFTIIAIMLFKAISGLYTSSQTTQGMSSEALYYGVSAMKNMDFAIALLVVFFIIGIAAAAYALSTNPIVMPFFLFLVTAIVLLGAWFANSFLSMFSNTDVATEAQQFTLTVGIFSRLPLIMGVGGLIILVFLFFKPTVPGGRGGA